MKRFLIFFSGIIFFCFIIYYGIGFYIASSILKMDHTCGLHENSLPNTWSTKVDVYNNNWFDTIYHEHLDYHSVKPFILFFNNLNMELISVDRSSRA